ncbi:MAG: radical SAM protein [Candidatus Parabeggiatoa sp.]|nr:radical SAM protein [Candidatus Parabeggiatoa sp.]
MNNIKMHKLSFLVTSYKDDCGWVLYNWANTQNIVIDDKLHPLYQLLEEGNARVKVLPFLIDGDDSDFKYLQENLFIVDNDDEAIKYVEHKYHTANHNDTLDIILMPVNQACNFDCIYCYEDHSIKHRMVDYDANAILKFIQGHQLCKLGVDYFGGEPLLNSRFILFFNKIALEYSKNHSIEFTSSMTTNGYLLTADLFLKLLNVKVNNFQISLDGMQVDHDKLRPLKNGRGTFSRIYNNLVEISNLPKKYEFIIIVRINFNEETASQEKQKQFLEKLKAGFGYDERFVINPHVIVNWKGHVDENTNLYIPIPRGKKVEGEYRNNLVSHKLNPFNMVNYSGLESNSCYADKKNTFVIFPSKSSKNSDVLPVQKCTIGIFDDFNSIGHIDHDGQLFTNNNISKWVTGSPFKKEECKKCFFVLNCYGSACPLNTIRTNMVKCPDEKYKEVETVKEIMSFIQSAN